MKKKIILSLVAVAALAIGVVGMSAFEAHVINVTATIENALFVPVEPIEFGTVFPQEQLNREIAIGMSASFIAEGRADDINYVIKQKPKCKTVAGGFVPVTEKDGNFVCPAESEPLLSLCPYLSKTDADPADGNDTGIPAFHGSLAWTVTDSEANVAVGRLAKSQTDITDLWNIDLKVPCFAGQCAQDWNSFVTGINPQANPANYIQPTANEHKLFGCDLWFETTNISRIPVAPENYTVLSLENKHGEGWFITTDNTYGVLQFKPIGTPFTFNLTAQGLTPSTEYSLIYYADPWAGNHPGALIWSGPTDASGKISVISGSKDIGTSIPGAGDANATGGKIWLIPSSAYDEPSKSVTTWPYDQSWLFEHNLVNYNRI